MSAIEKKSRKPANTAFKQQRLKSWQPILTPKGVLPSLFFLGAAFALLGGLIFFHSDQINEITIDYTDCDKTNGSFTKIDRSKYNFGIPAFKEDMYGVPNYKSESVALPNNPNKINVTKCTIIFATIAPLPKPLFLYYELTNFYQNHRSYAKSLSYPQLDGSDVTTDTKLLDSCTPLIREKSPDGKDGKPYYPCGLIANSVFNGLINVDNEKEVYQFSEKNISWAADRQRFNKAKFPLDLDSVLPPPNWQLNYPNGTYSVDYPPPDFSKDEHLMVWMRVAALPKFRKMYGRNDDQDLPRGNYKIEILMNYNISKYGGTKSLVISNVGKFVERGSFLGFAYIGMGAICVFAAIIFTGKHVYHPRKLGDHTFLSWNQNQNPVSNH